MSQDEKKSHYATRAVDEHEGAAFHHESAAHHHREAARHASQGNLSRAERHAAMADDHANSAHAHRDAAHEHGKEGRDVTNHRDRAPSDARRGPSAPLRTDRDRSMDGRPKGDGRRPARASEDGGRGDGAADRDRNYSSPSNRSGTSDGMRGSQDRDRERSEGRSNASNEGEHERGLTEQVQASSFDHGPSVTDGHGQGSPGLDRGRIDEPRR